MIEQHQLIPVERGHVGVSALGRLLRWVAALALAVLALFPAVAVAADNPSGLPLPRFVTTRSSPINVRVGPGTRYGVAWVYVKAGVPVEIVQEFDVWRKIRDHDGSQGWVHQNLLSGARAALVQPANGAEQVPLRSEKSETGGVRAFLGPGFTVHLSECDGTWCDVTASTKAQNGSTQSYSGFLPQAELWGVYPSEQFD